MTILFSDVVKPSFEIDFWFRHFKDMDYYECRAYEQYIMTPVHDDLYFTDEIDPNEVFEAEDNFGYDPIDVVKEICHDSVFLKKKKEFTIPEVLNVNIDKSEYVFIENEEEEY